MTERRHGKENEMTHLRDSNNNHGTPTSVHRCDRCGGEFTVTPRVPEERRGEWNECLSEDCDSYEPMRDVELYMGLGLVGVEDA